MLSYFLQPLLLLKQPVFIADNRPNEKWDLTLGVRPLIYLSDKLQLLLEYNFQLRDFQEYSNGIVGITPGIGQMNKFMEVSI